MSLPLDGIKVIEFSHMVMGPAVGLMLADFGAEVIKVEPIGGDKTRRLRGAGAGYFPMYNRNKKSLTVDITTAKGQDIIKQLIADSDILVENFKVGGLKKYGLDYVSIKQDNPRLIYASLTGFGQTGPDAKRPGYDYIIQGLSGLMSITGPSDGEPPPTPLI